MTARTMTTAEFDTLFDNVSNWERWDENKSRGTLNHLTPERMVAAARLVRSGQSVGLGLPLGMPPSADNPVPAEHRMTQLADDGSGTVRFVKDFIGDEFHNDGHSHLDALCHVSYRGTLFAGEPETSVDADGASLGNVETVRDGIVGRGVLLDIPRLRGTEWVEPGDQVQPEELVS